MKRTSSRELSGGNTVRQWTALVSAIALGMTLQGAAAADIYTNYTSGNSDALSCRDWSAAPAGMWVGAQGSGTLGGWYDSDIRHWEMPVLQFPISSLPASEDISAATASHTP